MGFGGHDGVLTVEYLYYRLLLDICLVLSFFFSYPLSSRSLDARSKHIRFCQNISF
jgi:hypothetical protein